MVIIPWQRYSYWHVSSFVRIMRHFPCVNKIRSCKYSSIKYNVHVLYYFQKYRVSGKQHDNVFGDISQKTRAILMTCDTRNRCAERDEKIVTVSWG